MILFATGLDLSPGEDYSSITCIAEDVEHRSYPLAVEYVRAVPQFDWLRQIIVRLPDELAGRGDVSVIITVHELTSNRVIIKVR